MDLHRLVAEQAPAAISVHDLEGRYRWASPGLRDLLGYEAQTLIGRDAYELFHPEDVSAIRTSHETVVALPTEYTVEYRIRCADGTYLWVETTSRSVTSEQAIVAVTRPVNGRRSAERALEAQRTVTTRLEEMERQRHAFVTTIAHRARNPMTIVAGMIEMLSERWPSLDPAQIEELLTRTVRNVEELKKLLEDVTRAERLTRRAARFEVRPVHLAQLASDRREAISDPDAPVAVDIPEETIVFGDRHLLEIVVQILLDNAIEHTPVGTTVWVRSDTHPDGTVLVIEDDGPGVEPAAREEIFEPFTHGPDSAHDPGLGLGLHTVAEIASIHRGRAWVQERPGGGASFRVLIPTVTSEDPDGGLDATVLLTDGGGESPDDAVDDIEIL